MKHRSFSGGWCGEKGLTQGTKIDWNDVVVKYGLDHRIKYARLVQRKASSPRAAGADPEGFCYFVQLALEGVPYHKPNHPVGSDIIGPIQRDLYSASLSAFLDPATPTPSCAK